MRNRINRTRLNRVGVNVAFINRTRINWAGDTSGGAGEGDYELIPNCWMLETPEGSAFTCKGPKGEQTFVFAEKYNLAQYGDVVFATDFGEQKIAPFGSYMDGSFGLAEDYPTVGIALETNGHILLLIREHSTQTFTGYKIIKDNIILKDKNGKKVRFIQFEGKSTDPNAVYKFNLGILPLYTPTNSPAKSSADNLNDKIKGMNNVRVF